MAKIHITIEEKKNYPHQSFRKDELSFSLEGGYGIEDAFNVLIELAEELGETIKKGKEDQRHQHAIELMEVDKFWENRKYTFKEWHEKKKCNCYSKMGTNGEIINHCEYANWINEDFSQDIRDKNIIASTEY